MAGLTLNKELNFVVEVGPFCVQGRWGQVCNFLSLQEQILCLLLEADGSQEMWGLVVTPSLLAITHKAESSF